MSKYFNFFPQTLYTSDTITGDVVKNLTARFSFEESFKNNTAVCYQYDVQDSDTPEIIMLQSTSTAVFLMMHK